MTPASSATQAEQTAPCPICGGTQWVSRDVPVGHPDFGKLFPCSCQQTDQRRALEAARRASRDLIYLAYMTFETFRSEGHAQTPDQRTSLQNAYDGARRFADDPRGWLLVLGGYGVGKTHLAAAIADARLSRGLPVIFMTTPDLLDYLRAAFNPHVEETYTERFEQLLDAPLLILDDLGTQNATSWAEEKLFQLLNHRYIARLPTVITTNLDLDNLDPRIASRLADMDLVRKLPIDAPDYRRNPVEFGQSDWSSLNYYSDKTFDTFDLRRPGLAAHERDSLKEVVALARQYADAPQDWLMFTGAYGCGKTHLAAAIANVRYRQGYAVLFVVVPDLLDYLRATFSPDSKVSYDQRFEEVRTAPLLILDDLGTESTTPWAREKLYQIFNHRYVARLPTVITTTLTEDKLDPPIQTRILDATRCRIVPITAPNYRGKPIVQQTEKTPARNSVSRPRGRTR